MIAEHNLLNLLNPDLWNKVKPIENNMTLGHLPTVNENSAQIQDID